MIPRLETTRLLLRGFDQTDEQDLLRLISEKEVAATTLRIPHPCTLQHVQDWLAPHGEEYQAGKTVGGRSPLRKSKGWWVASACF